MKKIVGIIAALALASAVFADPDVAPTVSSFKGDASLEWQFDLENETHGMKNSQSTEFKIVFVPETTKATEGSDMWGELEIKVAKVEVTGGNGFGSVALVVDDTGAPVLDDDGNPTFTTSGGSVFIVPGLSVEKAKIHFSDDDFYVRMNIKAPGLSLGGGKYVLATRSDADARANPAQSVKLTGAQGFTLEFGLTDTVDFNLQFADNGVAKDKKYAFVFDASVKAVENLELVAGAGYSTEEEKFAVAFKTSYKVELSDTMYLKPSVGFAMKDDAKALGAALFLGWGAENAEPGFKKFGMGDGIDNIPNKCSDGVSFWLNSDLDNAYTFLFSVYDSTFVPGLKAALDFGGDLKGLSDAWELNAAAKYSNTFDIWTIDANFGLKVKKGAETNTGFLYGFGVSTDNSLIQNTKLYINYAGEKAADVGGVDNKGKVTVGTQIHF
ncbi:MAG: hypothetical protein J5710_04700 [Treponema sp.]|nr:hypothetical protein [Treponema sp.]